MRKTFTFGKIDFNGTGRKINKVTVDIRLDEKKEGEPVFTASASIWNSKNTDSILAGQCLDDILPYIKSPTYKKVHRLWSLYHLNDMHAGTQEQEDAIVKYLEENKITYDYTLICDFLKSVGLYEVVVNNAPYKYGHGWLYRAIPENDLQEIKNLFKNN